ncbi:MAG: hypothetical protein IJO43_00625 [Bacilli bacterium]|nr:hypothetical protein [Bacilli bacterium]
MEDKELSIEQLNLVIGGTTLQGAVEFASKNNMDEILNGKSVEELTKIKAQLESLSYGNQSDIDEQSTKKI